MTNFKLSLSWIIIGFIVGFVKAQDQRKFYSFDGTIELGPVSPDDVATAEAIAAWETATEDTFLQAYLSRPDSLVPDISDPSVSVSVASVEINDSEDPPVWQWNFNAMVDFIPDTTDFDAFEVVVTSIFQYTISPIMVGEFITLTGGDVYIIDLQESQQPIFASIETFSLSVGALSEETPPESSSPTATPTLMPSMAPTGSPVATCGNFGQICQAADECCSDRCVFSKCQKAIPAPKKSLADGRGGAAGAVKGANRRGRKLDSRVRGARMPGTMD